MKWIKLQMKCPSLFKVNNEETKINSMNVCSCVIIIGSETSLAPLRQTFGHLFVNSLNLRFHFIIINKISSVNGGR